MRKMTAGWQFKNPDGSGRRVALRARPARDLTENVSRPHAWVATGISPRFVLEAPDGGWPCGWVLFDSRLVRHTSDYSAKLYFDTGNGFGNCHALDIPVTLKGTVHELVYLPRGLVAVEWAPMHAQGPFEQYAIQITKVSTLERVYRMARRVVPVLWLQPREKLAPLKLNVARLLLDLTGAYVAAGKLRAYAAAPSYPEWIRHVDTLSDRDRALIKSHIERFAASPHFVLLVAVRSRDLNLLSRTLDSISGQLYRNVEIVLLDATMDGANRFPGAQQLLERGVKIRHMGRQHLETSLREINDALGMDASDVHVSIIQAGDVLAEHALYWIASTIVADQGVGLIYSDEDSLDSKGERCKPKLKPDWSPELARSTNYIGQLVSVRGSGLVRAGGVGLNDCFGDQHDLVLRVCDVLAAEEIQHIPSILIHRGGDALPNTEPRSSTRGLAESRRRIFYPPNGAGVSEDSHLVDQPGTGVQVAEHPVGAVADSGAAPVIAHLIRNGISATVSETSPGVYRVKYGLPHVLPMVSILVPTRDAFDLLKRCIESIVDKTTYPNYEIVVIDNQTADANALEYLAKITSNPRVRVLRYDLPFNYSAINNFGVGQARGEVLCLLNNDTEVISPDWIAEMLGHLVQSRVGVVGAKLLYPDGRVQHAGDVVGVGGVANHLHAFIAHDAPGYSSRAVLAQDLSAVTAACMMTWRSLYSELGGLDAENLTVAFNDVDYCLRVRETGFRVVWTSHAELYHHESVSRGIDDTPAKQARAKAEAKYMRTRWRDVMTRDPFYNPNLSYERPDFSLSHAPLVQRPWHRRRWIGAWR